MQQEPRAYAIATLIARKMAGELTEAEQTELNQWIEATPENRKLYDTVIDPGFKTQRNTFLNDIDVNADWHALEKKVFAEKERRQISLVWYRVAAAVILVCITSAIFYLNTRPEKAQGSFEEQVAKILPGSSQAIVKLHNGKTIVLSDSVNQNKGFEESNGTNLFNTQGSLSYNTGDGAGADELIYNEIMVPRGGEYKVILSDGTKVWLNSETQLKFPVKFSAKQRTVDLTGEAYFEVAHESNRPFIVNTLHQGAVQVYGTEFNINSYTDNSKVWITLNEGKVSVNKNGFNEVMLAPDDQAILDKDKQKIAVIKVDASQFSAWKDGLLVFDNLSLDEISILLSRWYNVKFEFENERLREYRFTADIKRYSTFRDVLRFFEKTNQVVFQVEDKTIRVTDKKNP